MSETTQAPPVPDIGELERLAKAATPGPWEWQRERARVTEMPVLLAEGGAARVCDFGDEETYYPTEGTPPNEADRAFIAAANPSTVLYLIQRIRELENP